jgi:hypothetical protein
MLGAAASRGDFISVRAEPVNLRPELVEGRRPELVEGLSLYYAASSMANAAVSALT